jgi:hypothetical protein
MTVDVRFKCVWFLTLKSESWRCQGLHALLVVDSLMREFIIRFCYISLKKLKMCFAPTSEML